jgi:hypothetical protein
MDSRAQELCQQAGHMFENRFGLLSLWQTIAENFYVMRADFTRTRNLGEEFAANLLSSYPLIAHRELTGVMSSMLRRDKWFKLGVGDGMITSNASNHGLTGRRISSAMPCTPRAQALRRQRRRETGTSVPLVKPFCLSK